MSLINPFFFSEQRNQTKQTKSSYPRLQKKPNSTNKTKRDITRTSKGPNVMNKRIDVPRGHIFGIAPLNEAATIANNVDTC